MGQFNRRHIGRILLDGKFLTQQDLDRALIEQQRTRELLGQVLVRMGVLKEHDVTAPLMIQAHLGRMEDAVRIAAGERQLLGALLVQSGHITGEQLDHAIAEQKRSGEMLGEVFVRLGLLTERQLNGLLDFQQNQDAGGVTPLRLGELLVATGYISRSQLDDALTKQGISNKRLGEVLVEEGYVRPSQIQHGIRLQKMLVHSVLAAIMSLGIGAAVTESADAAAWDGMGSCAFSEQLKNPAQRSQYIVLVAQATAGTAATARSMQDMPEQFIPTDPEEMYQGITTASFQTTSDTYDPVSLKCLGCHDGVNAPIAAGTYRNDPGGTGFGQRMKGGDHPIGMDYAAYAAASRGFKNLHQLDNNIVLIDGKVGCLSCHNPLNPAKFHLSVTNTNSTLCLTCHNK